MPDAAAVPPSSAAQHCLPSTRNMTRGRQLSGICLTISITSIEADHGYHSYQQPFIKPVNTRALGQLTQHEPRRLRRELRLQQTSDGQPRRGHPIKEHDDDSSTFFSETSSLRSTCCARPPSTTFAARSTSTTRVPAWVDEPSMASDDVFLGHGSYCGSQRRARVIRSGCARRRRTTGPRIRRRRGLDICEMSVSDTWQGGAHRVDASCGGRAGDALVLGPLAPCSATCQHSRDGDTHEYVPGFGATSAPCQRIRMGPRATIHVEG